MELTDVTLREGGQMPGRSYTVEQKVEAGRVLDRLGVSVIQTGFPATGERDTEATRRLAGELEADVCGIARAVSSDVDAVLDSEADVIDIFAPLSEIQLEHVMRKGYEEMVGVIADAVDYAADHGLPVHLTLMDAFRTDVDRLVEAFESYRYPEYVSMADTVGVRTPAYVQSLLGDLADAGVDLSRAGVHFHEDLGVGTANALVAADMGVGKADVSVASLGERAGNTAIEELVVAASLEDGETFGVDVEELTPVCREVLSVLGEELNPRKPILGEEVTRHEAGIHTAVMLDVPSAFEPFDPGDFGGRRELIFGEGTGEGGARKLLERAGKEPTNDAVSAFLGVLGEEGPVDQDTAVELAGRIDA